MSKARQDGTPLADWSMGLLFRLFGSWYRALVFEWFAEAGVSVSDSGGPADVVIHDPRTPTEWIVRGSLGMGETYMWGWWDARNPDVVLHRLARLPSEKKRRLLRSWRALFLGAASKIVNVQTRGQALELAASHYDLGNDFFFAWLDESRNYSCAFWEGAETLEEAQVRKMEMIARKLSIEPGMRILDVGCGFGGLAKYLAERHGASVVGVTISREQARFAREHCRGLDVDIRLCDYRDISGHYDRVVSVGMVEHVGHKNYRLFMEMVRQRLERGGLFLLQTIGTNRSGTWLPDRFIARYIFPGGLLPSMAQLSAAAEGLFVIEDVENFGAYYDLTLLAWHERFEAYLARGGHGLGDRFARMWRYYLLSSAAAFRARSIQLWQVVYSRKLEGVYRRDGKRGAARCRGPGGYHDRNSTCSRLNHKAEKATEAAAIAAVEPKITRRQPHL